MARTEKMTFEITSVAADALRDLKRKLEQRGLPIKQRDIVEHLLIEAKFSTIARHFEATTERRIGVEQSERRERRRAAYLQKKVVVVRPRRSVIKAKKRR